MRILYVQHDMLIWSSARQWSYTTHMAYVDGLRAHGHEVLVLLTSCWSWARSLVGDHKFDQVWINDCTHVLGQRPAWEAPAPLGEDDFAWLSGLAPVRIGIVMESMHYDAADYAEVPELGRRVPLMQKVVLPHVTHLCVVDEVDVRHVENMGVQAVWTPCHVPGRFFRPSAPDVQASAVFIGSAYRRRAKYLQQATLVKSLEFKASSEHATPLPALFDQLNGPARLSLLSGPRSTSEYLRFVDGLHKLRAKLFELYLDGMGGHLATVNLPSFVKTYAGRVVESMAIGQPVVSWQIPARPQTQRLFVNGQHMVLFENDDPDLLAEALMRLGLEPGLAQNIGERALANAAKHHTSEHRVAQIIDWVDRGVSPCYWD